MIRVVTKETISVQSLKTKEGKTYETKSYKSQFNTEKLRRSSNFQWQIIPKFGVSYEMSIMLK